MFRWTPEDIKEMRAQKLPFRCHAFEPACAGLAIGHHLTKPRHTSTNAQVERMNRTINRRDRTSNALLDFPAACSRRILNTVSNTDIPISPPDTPPSEQHRPPE